MGRPLAALICVATGCLGLYALTIPLFGLLAYLAIFFRPALLLAEVGFGVTAVVTGGRWFWAYVLGNAGAAAGTAAVLAADVAFRVAQPGWHPTRRRGDPFTSPP